MTCDQIDELRKLLADSGHTGLTDVRSVKAIRAYAGDHPVIIEIEDGGPDTEPDLRYRAVVRTESGKVWASGNTAKNPAEALLIVHWQKLHGSPPE